jgi:hypothetical protein
MYDEKERKKERAKCRVVGFVCVCLLTKKKVEPNDGMIWVILFYYSAD